MKILFIIIIIAFILLLAGYLENFRFKKTVYTINANKFSDELCGEKIVIMSDLHNMGNKYFLQKLMKCVEHEHPKFILIAGDVVNGTGQLENSVSFLNDLSDKYKIYLSEGNHELELKKYFPDKFKQLLSCNIVYLDNESQESSPFRMYGLSIDETFYNRFKQPQFTTDIVTDNLGRPDEKCYNILVAHTPAYIDEYCKWGADLVVCGHYHGGFVRIPFIGGVISPQLKLFPKNSGGHYKIYGSDVIVSRGLGSHTIPIRLFNTPEMVVVNFE